MMANVLYFLCARSFENIDDMDHAEFLFHSDDAREEHLREPRSIEGLGMLRGEAVIAGAAIRLGISLAKIFEQRAAPAGMCFYQIDQLIELFDRACPFFGRFSIEELHIFLAVAGAIEENTIAGQAVTTGAPGLLVIRGNTFRKIVMNNETDIRLVDAHSECDRRTDNIDLVAIE